MKRIGVTQRVVYFKDIDERRDMLDQRWYDFGRELDVRLIPVPNSLEDVISYIEDLNLEGFIFSGGNNIGIFGDSLVEGKSILNDDVAYERDKTEKNILKWSMEKNKPLIGVCRGLQFINAYFEGEQGPVDEGTHVAKGHEIQFTEKNWQEIYSDSTKVNSYHGYGISRQQLSDELIFTATYKDEVEAFRHKKLSIYGIMWHPERYETFRKEDISLFKEIL